MGITLKITKDPGYGGIADLKVAEEKGEEILKPQRNQKNPIGVPDRQGWEEGTQPCIS